MTSQTLRTIQSVFYGSLPVRQRTPRYAALRLLRATGAGMVLTAAFIAGTAACLAGILLMGGVLSFD